jgi:carbonic anhydrase/acetyltransferase-like protein (isoleucine patch superfamily)
VSDPTSSSTVPGVAAIGAPRVTAFNRILPRLAPDVFVADTARVIGDVELGAGSSVWYGAVVRGDVFHIRIGARVNLQDHTIVHVTTGRHATLIEDDVTVGHRVTLHGCIVRRGALIGMGATVMDGAEVGEGAMVGAGALVTPGTHIPPGMLAVGAPAKVVRALRPDEVAHLERSAAGYAELARIYREANEREAAEPEPRVADVGGSR